MNSISINKKNYFLQLKFEKLLRLVDRMNIKCLEKMLSLYILLMQFNMKDSSGLKNLLEKRIRKTSKDLRINLTFKIRQLKEESFICIKELQENSSII